MLGNPNEFGNCCIVVVFFLVALKACCEKGPLHVCSRSDRFQTLFSFVFKSRRGGSGAGEVDGASSPLCGAPVIRFIGPLRASAGRPVLLVWKVAWPSAGAHDDLPGVHLFYVYSCRP
jgi:hypothetical protein